MVSKNPERFILILFLVFYGGGIIAHSNRVLLPFSLLITESLLLISNIFVLYFVFKNNKSRQLIMYCLCAYLITFGCEVIGVYSGKVFGSYHYGQTLKWQFLEVPLVIGMNWVILMLGAIHITKKHLSEIYYPIFAALLLTLFDFIMEPTAIRFDYWQWKNNVIPIQNYIAWFLISMFFSLIYKLIKLNIESILLRGYFIIQFVFFLLLLVINSLN